MNTDSDWMQLALAQAEIARQQGEVPVGAVLIRENSLIAQGRNGPIQRYDPTAHAELCALRAGGHRLGNYRLVATTLYVTLEPCTMCVGAMHHARVARLVFGAFDTKSGAAGSVSDVTHGHNHAIEVTGGVLESDCATILREFFHRRRSGL